MSKAIQSPGGLINQLFDTWYAQLLRYACGQIRPVAAAEDLVQEVFLDLYETLLAGQRIEYPKAWTLCVLRRKAAESRRRPLGIDRIHETLESVADIQPDARAPDLHDEIERKSLRTHLDVLSEREEEVLLLRLEAMKCREIARALGISINSVNTYLARAIEKLHGVFAPPAAANRKVGR